MPSNKEWGPPLWKVLHGLAENLGKSIPSLMATDEAREIYFVLKFVDTIMPCALCQAHYKAWKKERSIEGFQTLRGEDLQEAVKKWLYDLHEKVNTSHEISSGLTVESLSLLYKDIDIRSEWKAFQNAIHVSGNLPITQENLKRFTRHYESLRKIVGK